MSISARIVLVFIVSLTASCATDIPLPRGNASSEQTKLRAAHHWDLVARDIAAQLNKSLTSVAPGRTVYIVPPPNPSSFQAALHEFVTTRLVDGQTRVALNPKGALSVTLSTRLVNNVSERQTSTVPLVAIAAGIMVAYNVVLHANRDLGTMAVLGSAAGYDVVSGRLERPGSPSKTELIVTASVEDGNQYLVRKTDVYYIDDADRSLFDTPPLPPVATPTRLIRVQGGQ